jgi:arylformamidase
MAGMSDRASEWIDVSVPIRDGMVCWPGDPKVRVERASDMERGDAATVSRLDLGAHTGTHVDAPVHFVRGGKGIHELAWDDLIGPCRVVHLPEAVAVVTAEVVDGLGVTRGERIVLRTRNSGLGWHARPFMPDYTYLSLDGARRLIERGARTVAIDYLSIAGGGEGPATHHALLSAGVCIIEGLDLAGVGPGRYELYCFPLRVEGGDGAPARVLLRVAT